MDIYNYVLFWICIIGLCLGSFYNVVILRSLSNESIVFPASKCPKCGHKLYAWHNIPVLSYIFLRGKCYFCKEKISIQYPLVEIATMLLFAVSYIKFGFNYLTLFVLLWVSALIIMTVTDLRERVVDCNIAILMALSGMIYNSVTLGWDGFWGSLAGLVSGFIVIEIVARTGFLFVKSRAMGEADSYVAGAMGAIFGFPGIFSVLLYSLLASMLFIIPMFLYKRVKVKDYLTFLFAILFVISILIYQLCVQNYITLIFLAGMGGILACRILRGIRTESACNYLPFVPALSAGTLIALFLI